MSEQIVTGKKYRILTDVAQKIWQRVSFWTKASDVEFNDGNDAESKIGAFKGITTSTNVETTGFAADATVTTELYRNLTANSYNFVFDYQDGKYGYNTDPNRGADTFVPFSSAGYSIPTTMSINAYYTVGGSTVRLPLKDIKKISFNWSKSYYCSAYIDLEKESGTTVSILRDEARGDKSSSITREFDGEEYTFIKFTSGTNGQSNGLLTINNFIAS